jgi:hypothetical protein
MKLDFSIEQRHKAEVEVGEAAEEESFQVGDKIYTASELRSAVKAEPVHALVVNLVLAAIMGVLWLWARRAPLPAIAGARAVFVVVQVVSAVVEPTTIYRGIIIKVIALLALGKGLRAALAAREAMRRPVA